MMNPRFKLYTKKTHRRPESEITLSGQKQEQLILSLARFNTVEHNIDFFYSPQCKHCMRILTALQPFITKNPKINFRKIDATSEQNLNLLESWLKGNLSVPVAILNNRFAIHGDVHFIPRLMYALQLTSTMPPQTKEDRQQFLLQK